MKILSVLQLVSLLVLAAACSRKVSSLASVTAAGQARIEAVAWQDTGVLPKTQLSKPITFKVTDSTGKPLSHVPIALSAVDITDLQERSLGNVVALLNEGKLSVQGAASERLSVSSVATEAIVGRVTPTSAVTGNDGTVEVTVISPETSNRVVAVVGQIVGNGSGGISGAGMAIYSTSVSGGSGTTTVTFDVGVSTGLSQVVAGESFDIIVQIKNKGEIVRSNDKFTLSLSSVAPVSPWKANISPSGDVDCTFNAGKCLLPGGPYLMNGVGQFMVTVADKTGGIQSGKRVFDVVVGKVSYIVLSNIENDLSTPCDKDIPLAQLNVANCKMTFSADDKLKTLYAVQLDSGGNAIGKPSAMTWSVTGPSAASSPTSASSKGIFDITKSGKGQISISLANGKQGVYGYEILPGVPSRFTVVSENQGLEVATSPFHVRLRAYDQSSNLCTNLVDPYPLSFYLDNSASSPNNTPPVTTFQENVIFDNGAAITTGTLFAPLATSEVGAKAPIIRIVDGTKSFLSDTISVRAGIETTAKMRSLASNGGNEIYSTAIVPMKTGDQYYIYVAGYDAYGNYGKDIDSVFVPHFVNAAPTQSQNADPCLTGADADCPIVLRQGITTSVSPKNGMLGSGYLTAAPTAIANSSLLISPNFQFVAALPHHLDILLPNAASSVVAGSPFSVKVRALDVFNNVVMGYAGAKEITITQVAVPSSWLGSAATVPSGKYICTFVAGVCDFANQFTGSSNANPIVLSVSEATVPNISTNIINVVASAPTGVVMTQENPQGVTQLTTLHAVKKLTDPTDVSKPYIQTVTADNSAALYAVVVDGMGNPIPATVGGNDYGTYATQAGVTWSSTTALTTPYPASSTTSSGFFTDFLSVPGSSGHSGYSALFAPKRPAAAVVIQAAATGLTSDTRAFIAQPGAATGVNIAYKNIVYNTDSNGVIDGPKLSNGSMVFDTTPVDISAYPAGKCVGFDASVIDNYGNVETGYSAISFGNFFAKNVTLTSYYKRNTGSSYAAPGDPGFRLWAPQATNAALSYRHFFAPGFYQQGAQGAYGVYRYGWLNDFPNIDTIDPNRNSEGGRVGIIINNGVLSFANDMLLCLAEVTPTPAVGNQPLIHIDLDSYADTLKNLTWPAVSGESAAITVVPGPYVANALAVVTNSEYDGGLKDGTQTAAWQAASSSNWQIDSQGVICTTPLSYSMVPHMNIPAVNAGFGFCESFSVDYRNGRLPLAIVKTDRAGNILGLSTSASGVQTAELGPTGVQKTGGLNLDIRKTFGVPYAFAALNEPFGSFRTSSNVVTTFGRASLNVLSGAPYSTIGGVTSLVQGVPNAPYVLNANTSTAGAVNPTQANVGSQVQVWVGHLDQFGNVSAPIPEKISFQWQYDDPSFATSSNWVSDPSTTYNAARALVRRSAPNDATKITTLPAALDFAANALQGLSCFSSDKAHNPSGINNCAFGAVNSLNGAQSPITATYIQPYRAHCVNEGDLTEDCYTDNIVITVSDSVENSSTPLPSTIANKTVVVPMRTYAYGTKNFTAMLCDNQKDCRNSTIAASKNGSTWANSTQATPAQWTHATLGNKTYVASSTASKVYSEVIDLYGNPFGPALGTFTAQTLSGNPILFADVGDVSSNAVAAESVLTWTPQYGGQAIVNWVSSTVSGLSAASGTQTVGPGAPSKLVLELWDNSATPHHMLAYNESAVTTTAYSPVVKFADAFGNVVTSFNGTASLSWNSSFGSGSSPEGFSTTLPTTGYTCTFVNGVCTLPSDQVVQMPIAVTGLPQSVSVSTVVSGISYAGSQTFNSGRQIVPGSFDHLLAIPNGTDAVATMNSNGTAARWQTSYATKPDGSTTFGVDICMVDAVGNVVSVPSGWSGHSSSISLSLYGPNVPFDERVPSLPRTPKDVGFRGTRSGIYISSVDSNSQPCKAVTGLSYDTWGNFQVRASDGNSAHDTPIGTSNAGVFRAPIVVNSLYAYRVGASPFIDSAALYVTVPQGATVGDTLNYHINTYDKYGDPIPNAMYANWAFTAPSSPATASYPSGTPAVIVQSVLAYGGVAAGVSMGTIQIYKSGTISQISASLTTPYKTVTAQLASSFSLNAGLGYLVKTYAPDAEAATTSGGGWYADFYHPFNLQVLLTDRYGNQAAGPSSVEIIASNPQVTNASGQAMITTACAFQPVAGKTPTSRDHSYRIDLSSGNWSGQVWYCYGHTVDITASVGTAIVDRVATVKFLPSLATISSLQVAEQTPTVTAGANNVTFDLTALSENQVIYGLDTQLNAISGSINWNNTFNGSATKHSVTSTNTLGTPGSFVNGHATVTHSIYAAKAYTTNAVQVTMSGTSAGGNAYSFGGMANSFTVAPAAIDELVTTAVPSVSSSVSLPKTQVTPVNVLAGESIWYQVVPTDAYGNINTSGCSTLSLTPSTTYTSPGGHNGTQQTAATSTLSWAGAYNYFYGSQTLYQSVSHSQTLAGCGTSRSLQFNVQPGAANYIALSLADNATTAVHTSSVNCPNTTGTVSAYDLRNLPALSCPALYAFMWDSYGNGLGTNGSTTCGQWSYSDLTPSKLTPPTGYSGASNASHSATLASASFMDGKLRCTALDSYGSPTSLYAETSLSGGVSAISVNHTSLASTLTAGSNNLVISQISLFARQGNVQVAYSGSSDVASIRVYQQGNPANATSIGVNQYQTLSLTSGASSTPISLSVTSAGLFTLSVTVRDVEYQANFQVIASPATGISLAVGQDVNTVPVVAGVPFSVYALVHDASNNKTNTPKSPASDCNLTMTGGNTVSSTVHGYSTYAPSYPTGARVQDNTQTWNGNWPNYAPWTVTLYGKGTNTLTVSGCGVTQNLIVTVNDAALDKVTMNNVNDSLTAHQSELLCANTSATLSAVACGSMYAFFWDIYGNMMGTGSTACDSWTLLPYGSSTSPAAPAASRLATITHTDYLDASLTCIKGAKQASTLLYGGTSRIALTDNYESPSQKTSITTGTSNLSVSAVKLFQRKNNIEIAKPDGGAQYIPFTTNSVLTNAGLGVGNPLLCVFDASGTCSTTFNFSFTATEGTTPSPITLGFPLFGKTATIGGIVVNSNVANAGNTTISMNSSVTAGGQFTVDVAVRDAYGNLTANGCAGNPLTITGGTTSPGGHSGTATAPVLPSAANQTSAGTYATQNVTLYNKGSNTLTFNVCGLSIQQSVYVNPAALNAVLLNNSNSAPTSHVTEMLCSNDNVTLTTSAVNCGTISPFFYDAYGNDVGTAGAGTCTSWTPVQREVAGGGTAPTIPASGAAFVLTNTDWVDTTVTCSKTVSGVTKTAQTLIYGGLKRMTMTVTPSGSPVALTAGSGNLTLTALTLYLQKNGSDIGKADAGFKMTQLTTTSSLTTAQLGLSDYPTCTFAGTGICPSTFLFNFTKTEANVGFTFGLWGKSVSSNTINVSAGTAHHVSVNTIATQKAGTAFNATFNVYDVNNNLTGVGCGGTATPTGFSLTGGTTSAGGHSGTATAPVLPQTTTTSATGVYTVTGINLYARATHSLTFYACGAGSPALASVVVSEGDLNTVTLHTTDVSNASHASSLRCDHTGTATDVQCNALYAFFWDAYGNTVGTTSDTCDSWSWANGTGAGTPGTTPAVSASASHSNSFTHTSNVNGNLTCSRTVNGVTKTNAALNPTNVYGGISRMAITYSVTGGNVASLGAANSNVTLTAINLYMLKGSSEVAMENAGTLPVALSTDYSTGLAGLGSSTPQNCTFNSSTGLCSPNWSFNFTVPQSGRTLSFAIRTNFTQSITGITVIPNTASQLTVNAIGTVGVGSAFTPVVNVKDAVGNYTTSGCTSLNKITFSGAATSNGISGGSGATAPVYPTATQVTSAAAVTMGNMQLYSAGTYNLTVTACGLTNSVVPVTVTAGAFNAITLNQAATDDPNGTPITSAICSQNVANDATNGNITCPTIRAFFWDQYGNQVGTNTCDSWTWTPYGSSDTPAGGMVASGHTITPTHTRWIDGKLTCSKTISSTLTKNVDIYGGTAAFTNTSNYSASAKAANPSISLTNITLQWYKQGTLVTKTDATGSVTTAFTTTSAVNSVTASQPFTFASGVVSNPTSFAFTKVESSNSKITMKVFNVSQDVVTNINITPANASSLSVAAVPTTATAGTAFNSTVTISDAYSNLTSLNTGGTACGTLVTTGATNSPGGNTPTTAAASLTGTGTYGTFPLTLVNKGTETLTFTACGVSNTQSVTVSENVLNTVKLSTISNDAAPNSATAIANPYYCGFTNATDNSVTCGAIYAYALDAYGNAVGSASSPCTTWGYLSNASGNAYNPTLTSSAKSQSLTNTDYFDGTLTCSNTTNGGGSASTNVYGGVKSVAFTTTPALPATVVATSNNVVVNTMNLYTSKGGVGTTPLPTGGTATQTFTWSTTATNTSNSVFGGSATSTCAFATGVCNTAKNLSFTAGDGANKTFTMSVRGKSATSGAMNILSPSTVTVSPTLWALGNVVQGSAAQTQTFTFTNASGNYQTTGTVSLSALGNQFSFLGGSAPGTGGTCGSTVTTLAAGASCTAVVQYNPVASGSNSSTLQLNFNDGLIANNKTAALTATSNTVASLASSPSSKDFGTRPTNSSGANNEQTFTITNSGQTTATGLSGSALGAPYAYKGGTFPGTGGTCTNSGSLAGNNATCTVVVTYLPTGVGATNTTFNVAYNNGLTGTQTSNVTVQGTAVTPASLSISDASYAYGNVVIGNNGSKQFTVTNNGGYIASSVGISGITGAFSQTATTCTTSLAAAGTCTVTVQFAPSATGSQNVTINVAYNDGNGAQNANNTISGFGLNPASITASPSSVAAGTVAAGSVSEATVTFTNASGNYATASITSVANLSYQFVFKGGTSATGAPGTGGTCGSTVTTLAAGASCTVVIQYAPTVAETDNSTLQLNFNNGVSATNKPVALSGTATPIAANSVTPSLTVAGNKTAGSAFTIKLLVKDMYNNLTDVNCNTASISISGATSSLGGGGGTITTPIYASTMTKNSTGNYTTANVTLYNAEESPSLTVNACGVTSSAVAVTVQTASVNSIWLTDTDAEPSSDKTSLNCGDSESLSCNLYAYGWDSYGNSYPSQAGANTFTCSTWSITNNTAPAVPSLSSSASSHSTAATQSAYHIASTLNCAVGAVHNAGTALTGKIHLPYTDSCSKTCDGGTPNNLSSITCNVTNNTGYASSFQFKLNGSNNASVASGNCLTGTGTCSGTALTGVPAANSATVDIVATPGAPTNAQLIDPTTATLTCP